MTVAEMFVIFGLEVDKKSWARGFAAITALKSAVGGVIDIIETAAHSGNKIAKLSEQMGLTTQQVQEWGYVATQSGSNLNQLGVGIRMLERNMWSMTHGGKNKSFGAALQEAGISADLVAKGLASPDGLNEVLYHLADRFKEMGNTPERAALATKLFGAKASEMSADLQRGGPALREMIQHLHDMGGVLSDIDVHNLKDLDNATNDVSISLRGIANQAIARLAPALTKMLHALTAWIAKHREVFTKMLMGVVNGLAIAFTVLGHVIDAVTSVLTVMVDNWALFGSIMAGIIAALMIYNAAAIVAGIESVAAGVAAAAAWALAALPIVLLGVLIAALILIVDDLITGFKGGRSVIFDFFHAIGDWADTSDSAFAGMIRWVEDFISKVKEGIRAMRTLASMTPWGMLDTAGDIKDSSSNLDDRHSRIGEINRQLEELQKSGATTSPSGWTRNQLLSARANAQVLEIADIAKLGMATGTARDIMHAEKIIGDPTYLTGFGAKRPSEGQSVVIHNMTFHIPPGANAQVYAEAVRVALGDHTKAVIAKTVPGGRARSK